MRLTLVISSLGRGGAERALSLLASAWADQGKEVTVLRLDHGEAPAYPLHASVKLRSLGLLAESHSPFQGIRRNFSRIRILRRAISESQPDMVISFMDRTNVRTLLATRGLGCPVVVCEQTDPALFEIGRIWKFLRRVAYPFADVLVCPMPKSLARFQAMTRVRGVVIPNPIAVPPDLAVPVRSPHSPSAERVLLAMGRLVPQKGFDLLLTAFSTIASHHPGWKLDILGDGPLLGELQEQAASLNLQDRVHFCGAVADPFSKLCAADLFVFSSRFEGFGMALAEAMACELPAVSFDCPEGPASIIRDGVDGVLVPAQDVGALAAALDRLMSDPQERQKLAARAPEVRQRFSTERVLSLWQEVFDRLLPNDTGSTPGTHSRTKEK
jgi:GalNAc-alpha-(1->4)-GalNAc-alpha-(1->3)-diNAcBac-PP-undecaprenol alpha-1,4-N-acetyl-D-galactosaminyltransferase